MQPKEVFTKFKRRFSNEEKKRPKNHGIDINDAEYCLIISDVELQRDFREYLNSTGLPDLLGYFDFVLSCQHLRHIASYDDLTVAVDALYQRYMRSYATEKIQLDDFGAIKRRVECDLGNRTITPFIFDAAMVEAYRKLKQPLARFMRPYLADH